MIRLPDLRSPRSFAGQTLATTIAVLLAAQILAMVFFGLLVLLPQAQRVAGIVAQSVAAVSDAAELSEPAVRAAIIKRLDASEFIDVWPGGMAPPASGPPPRLLERVFMQAFADALTDRTDLEWRTDAQHRVWIRVRIGPELHWISARSPTAMQPLVAVMASTMATFLLALLAVIILQRRLTRPLESLTAAVAALGASAPRIDVDERGPSELVALSRGFNAMTDRLAAAERERAILLAGVSHDIRTPLAKLRLTVEMLAKGERSYAQAANGYVEEIDRVLAQFLVFARGFEMEPEVLFDLEALISELVSLRAVEGAEFIVAGSAFGLFRGRPEALRRALVNLTENALRYGEAPFAIGAETNGEGVDVFVRDSGKGVAADALDQLRRPFVRGDEGAAHRGGSGLGLAIVERVATQHGGALKLKNLEPSGFEARLCLKTTPPG